MHKIIPYILAACCLCMVSHGWKNGQMAVVFLYGRNTGRTGCTGLLQDTFPTRILLS